MLRKALPLIGISTTKDQIDRLFDYMDDDGSGQISYVEMRAKLKAKQAGACLPALPCPTAVPSTLP